MANQLTAESLKELWREKASTQSVSSLFAYLDMAAEAADVRAEDLLDWLDAIARHSGQRLSLLLVDLAYGIERLSPISLDNLVILVDRDKAYKAFAKRRGHPPRLWEEQQDALARQVVKRVRKVAMKMMREEKKMAENTLA